MLMPHRIGVVVSRCALALLSSNGSTRTHSHIFTAGGMSPGSADGGIRMYYNRNGEKVSRSRFKEMYNAFKNRQELIKAGLTRRDLMKMGLLTGAGMLIAKNGLSSRAFAGT